MSRTATPATPSSGPPSSPVSPQIEQERQLLAEAMQGGFGARLRAYVRLSGPGWLQSAITLGGGSLASSLYLGVLGGYGLLWLQPLAMILGIIMLSAIGYVTLSTGMRPFRAINEYVNPVLGWSWALASLMANMVWCLPQFSLANSVLQLNLAPELLGAEGPLGSVGGKVLISSAILLITVLITWSYGSGHWGIKLYEVLLKVMVATIVACFVLVVAAMARAGQLDWSGVLWGFVPDLRRIFEPAAGFTPYLEQLSSEARAYWSAKIVDIQRDRMVAAAATAVGINMTFLFPYSILRKGWTKEYRGLQRFDLATGMLIPFVLATSCVVIASAKQFHTEPVPGLVEQVDASGVTVQPLAKEQDEFRKNMTARLQAQLGPEQFAQLEQQGPEAIEAQIQALPRMERMLGAMLVERDANRLAQSLAPLTGGRVANWLFGIGVIGMTLSTITLLMLISGFVLSEIFNFPAEGWKFRLACLPAAVGVLGPFAPKAGFALAIPTSVFGFILLPIAYLTFFLLMNQRRLLGAEMPRGGRRLMWNVLMSLAAGVATVASLYMIWNKAGYAGLAAIAGLLTLALVVQISRAKK